MTPSQDHDTSSGHEVVLIADDDEFFRMALKTILQRQAKTTRIIEAGSFDEAMEHMAEVEEVSLALFDLAMPGMKSAATLRAVREQFPHTKMVVASASKRRSDILQALEAGAHGYVPKGLGIKELSEALQEIRLGRIYVPSSILELAGTDGKSTQHGADDNPLPANKGEIGLTPRQMDVLSFLVKGLSNKEIAQRLGLGEGTVKVHVAAIFRALNVTSRAAAAALGAQLLGRHQSGSRWKPERQPSP